MRNLKFNSRPFLSKLDSPSFVSPDGKHLYTAAAAAVVK
jgi:hypothetical protein